VRLRTKIKTAARPSAALLHEAERARVTLIVVGVAARPSDGLLFGAAADQLLETSRKSLLFVAS
jgi:nucleotide-binding universal stress UspA family protein